jgi:hypothetical protein
MSRRAWARATAVALVASLFALGSGVAAADSGSDAEIDVTVRIPGSGGTPATGERTVTDAVLAWAINAESGSGAFFGQCNFLSAGKAGNAGSATVWPEGTSLYRSRDGNVTIQKPVKSGNSVTWRQADWAGRCIDESDGTSRTVTTSGTDYGTGNRVSLTGGTGTVNASAGQATIRWKGSFTVAFYGGLAYWWVTDPVLTVRGGTGTLTATAGGYGTSIDDLSDWRPLSERTVTLATLPGVGISDDSGFSVQPAYRQVTVTPPSGGVAQVRTGPDWGAFPQDFVTFQAETGQGGYWYSTGGARDFAKPAYPVYVSYSAADRVDDVALPTGDRTGTSTTASPATAPATSAVANAGTRAASPVPTAAANAPVVAQTYPATVPDQQTAAGDSLIPTASAVLEDPRARLVVALSGLVVATTAGVVGFRKRWLTLPWTRD